MEETDEEYMARIERSAERSRAIASVVKDVAELILLSSVLKAAADATGDRWVFALQILVGAATVIYILSSADTLIMALARGFGAHTKPRFVLVVGTGVLLSWGAMALSQQAGNAMLQTAFARAK